MRFMPKDFSPRDFIVRHEAFLLYVAKCCVGAAVVRGLGELTHLLNAFWCLVSLVLVLTPDGAEAVPLAVSRTKANFCGCIAAVVSLLFGPPGLWQICLALTITAVLCKLWNAMTGSRTAMAATVIILWHDPGRHLWDAALDRVSAVFFGCLLGLGITLLFHRRLPGLPALKHASSDKKAQDSGE